MLLPIDRRYKFVRSIMNQAYPQMTRYFACRYSWGQPCDPMRAKDWAYLAGYLATCRMKGLEPDYNSRVRFPSGNLGSPGGLIEHYHDGFQLLEDLGLIDPQEAL